MGRTTKVKSSRRDRAPDMLNSILSGFSSLSAIAGHERPMPISRRNVLVRTIGAVCGDLTVGVAVASAVTWVIQAASLNLFLSFLLWMLGAILALALSQYVVHPLTSVLLSDRKLDLAFDALDGLTGQATRASLALVARMKTAS